MRIRHTPSNYFSYPCFFLVVEGRYLELNVFYEKLFFIVLVVGYMCFLIPESKSNTSLFDNTNLEIVKHDTGCMDLVLANLERSFYAPRDQQQSCPLVSSSNKEPPTNEMVKKPESISFLRNG